MVMWCILAVVAVSAAGAFAFINQPAFGRTPRGERLERINRSPNYRQGAFQNEQATPLLTSGKSRMRNLFEFAFRKTPGLRPDSALPVVRKALATLNPDEDAWIWFGHSSYLIQIERKRLLVDPVFYAAAPVSFLNKPFRGTDVFRPEEMPDIDYLVITHDHWDHLDYRTVTELKDRIGKVVCPLGVGEHFEYWGFDKEQIVELDWHEKADLAAGLAVHCLPARHFSGRGLTPNQALWASYLLETPTQKIYLAGDGGYGTHYAAIGKRFAGIDLAILENGQYNDDWRYIHLMPQYMAQTAKELGAKKIVTVHHSKYALAKHPWDEPLKNAREMAENDSLNVLMPQIGEVTRWKE